MLLLLLAARLPLLNHPTPANIDEVYFMNGLGFPAQYPVHHPGYPLWVAMGTLLNELGCEPYRSFQVWSLLASLAAPLLFYVGVRWLVEDGLAWLLAMAFGFNPLVWFQSTTALSYLSACVSGLLVIGLCYRATVEGRRAGMYGAAVVLVVGSFLRADLLIGLGPMVAYVGFRHLRRGGWIALLITAAGCIALVGVTARLYARTDPAQLHPDLSHTLDVVSGTSVFRLGLIDGLLRNASKIAVNLGWDFGVAAVLLPWAIWSIARGRSEGGGIRLLLLLWALPWTAFLLLMHVVQGYFMLLLPAGYCAIGLALQSRCRSRAATRLAAVLTICSVLQFTLYPWSPESLGIKRLVDAKIGFQSAAGLRHIDKLPEIHQPGDFWPTAAYDRNTPGTTTRSGPE
ncbi:MAG TPA: hypothetical protein VMV94_19015 [Phycisphaerae bacterium]|nr:hypothetical protein [Phycisphaerae bacterium]